MAVVSMVVSWFLIDQHEARDTAGPRFDLRLPSFMVSQIPKSILMVRRPFRMNEMYSRWLFNISLVSRAYYACKSKAALTMLQCRL